MENQRKKRIEEKSDSAVCQIENKTYNNNHNKNRTGVDLSNINAFK